MGRYFTDSQINSLNADWSGLFNLYEATIADFQSVVNAAKPNILSGLSTAAKKAVWATALAYQMRYYGSNSPEPGTYSGIAGVYLPRTWMSCFSYCCGVHAIMEVLEPAYESLIWLSMQGMNGGYVGNHAQLWLFDTNNSNRFTASTQLMLDPTIGLIARCTFNDVFKGVSISSSNIHSFYSMPAYGDSLATLNTNVQAALQNGYYKPEEMYQHLKNKAKILLYANNQSTIQYWANPQA